MNKPRLENWSVVKKSPYHAPEQGGYLVGEVYGHPNPRFPDGKLIHTSSIESANGRAVKTKSGSEYELGEPSPDYRNWVRLNLGQEIDEDNPVIVEGK